MKKIYSLLLREYGRQEWWPMINDFSPKQWEVCVGAILTQNTNWKNVEKALENMKKAELTNIEAISNIKISKLEKIIRPSGFYKQKAERLKILAGFVLTFPSFQDFMKNVTREELLKLKGIGPETADSILLYALGRKNFVVDAYTKRIFTRLGFLENSDYEKIRNFFELSLKKDAKLYQEFHALIVEHAKRQCRKNPECGNCVLRKRCVYKN